ncbi:AAA ATPase midasin [Coemansia sp. D1744]|nr:AAA ATPase midasin [Coemansia sp. D1744]
MSASTVFGSSDSTAPTALEEFAVQIVSDVNYFQHVETPKHLVKKSGEAPAPLSSKKRIIKARGKQDVDDEPAYVEEDEERQKQRLRFWGEQRNLRRTRLKDIIKGLQEIGLRRHFRPIADDTTDTVDTADKDGKPAKSSALTGLTSVLRGAPLDISSWRESVLAASAIAPGAVHASMAQAQQSWQLSDMGFFRLSAQLAQLRTCAYEEHSTEVSAQQVQHIVGLMENLNSFVARDRTNAAGLLAATTSWMHVAASWGTVSDTRTTVPVRELKPRVDALIVQIELFARATRAVGDVDGWRNATGVAQVQGEIATAAVQVVKAQTMLATVGAGATAALLAGGSEDDAARVLATLEMAVQAEAQTRLAVEAVRGAVESSARLAEVRVAVEPWIEPVLQAVAHVDVVLGDPVAAVTVSDKSDVADVAGAWITAVMNVWQAIRKAEQQFSVSVEHADLNAWGLAPKELLRRLELMEQLVSALHVPTMLTLGQQLAHVCAQTPGAVSSAVVRPWVIQYSLVVQHVCALYSSAHQKLVQFALTTATVLTSVVVHGLGSNDIYDSEETNESMQNGTGMGEGSTAGAQNVSDEIEGEDQIEGVQNEEPDTTNEPDTNEDAVEMENDFQGAMGDADLETDDEDSDEESDDDEEPEMDEQMGDVDPTDPTSLDDKLWNDEEEKQEAKDEESKVDSKGQKQKDEEVDIVAGEEQGDEQDKDQDQDKDQNPDQGEPGDDEEMGSDEDEGSDDEGSDGDMDDRVNQDTLDRMADVEDQGEQLEMPDDLDMGDEEDEEEEGSDDGLDADMNELPEDQIEQKPDAMDEDRAEQAEDENMDDAVEGSDEQVDQGEDEGNDEAEDEAEDGSVDGDNAGDEGEDEAEGEEEGEDEDAKGLGEDAPEDDDRQNSGEKPTHGVDSAMNMDGTDDADPNTTAESRDAVSKPSDSSAADNQQQSANQSSAQQDSFMPPQESQDQSEQTESERKLNPERTLADVIEKWERRLNMVMRDEEEEETAGEKDEQADESDEAAPDSSEFEHTKPDTDFDKVALADASEQERDQQEFQPMDIDEQDEDQEGGEHETAPETAPKPEDNDAENDQAQPLGANPQPKPAQREHVPDAAQMQQSTAGERPDDEDTAMGYDDSDHEESNDQESDHEDSNDDDREVDVEQLRHELEEATAAWRANAQDSERALELWQQYTRLTHDLSLMLTEQLRLILTPTQATQLRGDYRTGKRLNMKRIIPYIASDYRKDKIWLRRTKPARREYHVMVAVDNSKSMAQSPQAVELAYETLALITTALNQLEVGQLAVVAFGEHVRLLHPFDASFDADAGARVLSRFSFAEDKTDVVQLMDASLRLFEAASSQADLWRLQLVISDGMCQDHAQLLRQVRAAMEQRIMIVFIVLDRSAIAAPGATDIDPETDSIMNTKRVSFVPGADGKLEIKTERYIDTFPFKYYVVLRDIHGLPSVLAETLRQYFSLVGTE